MKEVISKDGCSVYPIIVPMSHDLGSVNFFLLKDEKGSLSLIDAGFNNNECWEELNQVMANHGFTFLDLDRIILTHHHPDHVGLVNRILGMKEMPIYAHKDSIPRLRMDENLEAMRQNFYEQLYHEMGCSTLVEQKAKKRREYKDESMVGIQAEITPLATSDIIVGLTVVETPGHSPDHLAFYDKKRKWLFAGDLLISNTSSNAIVEPDRESNRMLTVVQYMNSLNRCLTLDIDVVFTGHGRFIYDHKKLIIKRLKSTDKKAGIFLSLIKTGMLTANELALTYYQKEYQSQFFLVMSEVIGHLDYLENKHEIYSKLKDGVRHYYAT